MLNANFNKKLLEMLANMNEDELKANLDKASKYLNNNNANDLIDRLKQETKKNKD